MTKLKELQINTPLNYPITITAFASKTTKAIVIILPATGVLQTYYAKLARFLQKNNYTVYTFDYGGIGKSKMKPLTKFDTSLSNWATNDIESVFKYINKLHPSKKINCIGHSLGGQLLGLVPSNKLINNIILAASPSNHYSFWDGFEKTKNFFNWFVIFPFFTTFFKYFPSKFFMKMENLPKSMAKEFYTWSQENDYYFSSKINLKKYHYQIKNKLTSYSTVNDPYAPKKAVDWLTKKYSNATIIRKHLLPKNYNVKNIGHFGFFKQKFENTIWQEYLKDLQD